jgi:hypothetical protein
VTLRTMPPSKGRGLLPQGPPPPLSAVEVAVLGGLVVTIKPKPRPEVSANPSPETYADDAVGPTPGALQGDDFLIEHDDEGYPILPACLRRRQP